MKDKDYLPNYYSTIVTTSGRGSGLRFMEDYNLLTNLFSNGCLEKVERLPRKYIVNADAAILFWDDGSKTVVKRCKEDDIDVVKAFLWAYFEKNSGLSRNKANKYLKAVGENVKSSNCELIELLAKNLGIDAEKLGNAIDELRMEESLAKFAKANEDLCKITED